MQKRNLLFFLVCSFLFAGIVYAAPIVSNQANINPLSDSTYYLGTTTPATIAWKSVITDELCLTGDSCKTSWPTGGGGGTFAWTPTSYGVSTSTTLGVLGGVTTSASSTFAGTFHLGLSNGGLGINNGLVYSGATTTAGTGLSYSGGAFNVGGLTTSEFASANISQWTNDSGYLTSYTSPYEIATTSNIAVSELAYISKTSGRTTLASVATGTVSSANSALTVTSNRSVIGGSLALTVSTTTTSMFTGTQGQILGYTSAGWTGVATTTFSTGLTYAAGAVTCDTASGSVFGCLASADWTTFNNKQPALGYTPWGGSISTNYAVPNIASTTVAWFQSGLNASSTSHLVYASTTAISAVTASSTNLIVSSAGGSAGCATFSVTGLISNTGSACGGSSAFAWTPTTNFAAIANATSTPIWFKQGLQASTTSQFDYSTTTAVTINSNLYLPFINTGDVLLASANGKIQSMNASSCSNGFGTSLSSAGVLGCSNNVAHGGTGQVSFTASSLLYGAGTGDLQSVATTSLGVSAPITFSGTLAAQVGGASGSFGCTNASSGTTGCLTGTDWATFNSKLSTYDAWTHAISGYSATTTNLYPAGLQTGTSTIGTLTATSTFKLPLSGVLLGNSVASAVTAASTQTCTNQFVRAMSSSYIATCASVNLTSGTDVTGTLPVANGGTGLGSFTANRIFYSNAAGTALAQVATSSLNIGGTAAGLSSTLAIASGGTNATSYTASNGILAYTGSAFANYTGYTLTSALLTAANASTTNLTASQSFYVNSERVYGKQDKSFTVASSTLAYSGWPTSTTTLNVWNPQRAITITDIYCQTQGGTGTSYVAVSSGTATSTVLCNSTGNSLSSLTLSIAARGKVYVTLGNGTAGTGSTWFTPTISYTSN